MQICLLQTKAGSDRQVFITEVQDSGSSLLISSPFDYCISVYPSAKLQKSSS